MSFQPVIPIGGLAGWSFLKRTMPSQTKAFAGQAQIKREEAYFREKIGQIDTAEQLVADPQLLRVALSAFGLEGDLQNRFFIQKILSDGTLKADALANKLANKQYKKFSGAFGFGDFSTPRNKVSDFADKILAQYRTARFATSVGQQNNAFRLALHLETELPDLAGQSLSPKAKWLTVLGNPPLREVFETAYGLPQSFGAINLDQQVTTLEDRTLNLFGTASVEQFSDPERVRKLVQRFLARADVAATNSSAQSGQIALILLQQTRTSMRL